MVFDVDDSEKLQTSKRNSGLVKIFAASRTWLIQTLVNVEPWNKTAGEERSMEM